MARTATNLALDALGAVEKGLAEGKTLDTGVLTSLIAGVSYLREREPLANEETAIRNLLGMLFTDTGEGGEAPSTGAAPPSPDKPSPLAGEGGAEHFEPEAEPAAEPAQSPPEE